ncbi:DUF4251 domain-containing protein [Eudoraea sp.]|uniref:DUF4251 domain-containing protein n=1 Tax=Eudoraea sp. TaxID=1979955 RepID=UPI003C70B763
MKNGSFKILMFLIVSGSLIAQTKEEKKQKKEDYKNVAYEDTKNLIDSGTYIFNASFVNGGMSLATNTNRFIVKEGEVDIDLPFFGSARGDGGYNSNPRIAYKGVPDKYDVEYIDKKRRSIIKIGIRSSNERHDITLTVGSSGQTTVKVISSSRSSINYSGYLKPLKE